MGTRRTKAPRERAEYSSLSGPPQSCALVPRNLEVALLIALNPCADDRAAQGAEVLDLPVDHVFDVARSRLEVHRPVGVIEIGPRELDLVGVRTDAAGDRLPV